MSTRSLVLQLHELFIIKTRVIDLWANNRPLFDDDKTHEVIYAWIKVKLQKKLPLNSCMANKQ